MKDGIYFNLEEKEYHFLNRLDYTGMKELLKSPVEYWISSNFNPLKEEEEKKCYEDGKIFHTYILEGEQKFMEKYTAIPGSMVMVNRNSLAFKNWCNLQEGKVISKKVYDNLKRIVKYLSSEGQLFDTDFLKNGYPEVSILWTEDGIQKKARIDYLKTNKIIDLKTIIKRKESNFNDYIKQYFFSAKIYMQLLFYFKALRFALENKLPVFGDLKQKEFIKKIDIENLLLSVVFLNREFPQFRIKFFIKSECPDLWGLGEKQIKKAESIYKENFENKKKAIWLENPDVDLTFKDIDFPQSFFEILT